jgi:hypothetical protein
MLVSGTGWAACDLLRACTQEGNTALHLAACGGHMEVMWELLRGGAQTEAVNQVGTRCQRLTPMLVQPGSGMSVCLWHCIVAASVVFLKTTHAPTHARPPLVLLSSPPPQATVPYQPSCVSLASGP